jgi:hypothetical protein
MKRSFIVMLLVLFALPVSAVETKEYTIFDTFVFSAPKGTKLEKIGLDAIEASRDGGSVVFYFVEKDVAASMPSEALGLKYFNSTYMATALPGEGTVERVIFGKKIKGERQEVNIPRPSILESYKVETNKGILFIGLKSQNPDKSKAFFDTVVSTLKVK